MHIKKSVFISFIFSLAVIFLFSSLVYAGSCPNPSPQDSQVFKNFQKVLQNDYFGKSVSGDEHLFGGIASWKMMGHALGRLALAVQGQSDRRTAFDCVQLALEQVLALKGLMDIEEQKRLFRIMMQAGYGMYDDEVDRLLKGGLPTEPLYDVFGGKPKKPGSSAGSGGTGGGGTTPTVTKKDPVVVPRSSSSSSGFLSTGGKVVSGSASGGHCSNWMTLSFSDSKGNLDPGETEKACTLTAKSGDFITKINPVTKACSVCSKDDWTPPPPPPPPIGTSGGTASGGTAGGGAGPGGGSSGKLKCLLYSGYLFSSKAGTEFNVLQAKKPGSMGYIEFLYTVGPPSKRFNNIERARKDAERIVKEGARGKQYEFAFRGGPDAFCNFIESKCDMKTSSVNIAAKGCKWSK